MDRLPHVGLTGCIREERRQSETRPCRGRGEDWSFQTGLILSDADVPCRTPCRTPGCSYTPVAALSAVSNVLQRRPPQRALSHPIPDPAVALILALGRGCVALPPASGVAGSLDLRNPVALQGVEQLHLRVSRCTLTLRTNKLQAGCFLQDLVRKPSCCPKHYLRLLFVLKSLFLRLV